jgi:predicted ATP-grasp superfamily ATP-dependent carboligase
MTAERNSRVLVFGDDMRIFLAVVRSLGRSGIEVHAAPFNWRSPALKSRYISAVHPLPRCSDDPAAWRRALLELLRKEHFDLLVPCCDRAILPLHTARQEFAGHRIAIPNAGAMDLLFDKDVTRQVCRALGIPVTRGGRLASSDTAKDLVARYGLPLVLKPRRSYWMDQLDAWGKVEIVRSEADLRDRLAVLADRSRYLVESFFRGVGVGVSVLARDGKLLQAFQHRRLREGKAGPSSYRASEPLNAELGRACEKICEHAKLTGVCMFEFRWNPEDGSWVLLETNARFWGSLPLPVSLGVDFPRFLFDLMVRDIVHPPVAYPIGIRSRNLLLDGFNVFRTLSGHERSNGRDAIAALADFFGQPLRWLTGRERSDSFVADDLVPAFCEFAFLLERVRGRRARESEPRRRSGESEAEARVAACSAVQQSV